MSIVVSLKRENNKALFAAFWILIWMVLTLGIIAGGAIIGALIFPVGGIVFGYDLDFGTMVCNGVLDGGFYAAIWAPGISFVVCLMAIRKKISRNPNNVP